MIRPARARDLEAVREIERAAGAMFRDVGMDAVADDALPSIDELAVSISSTWIFADERDAPVAYIVMRPVDGTAHIEQLSVHPRHARRRLGASLIDAAGGLGSGGGTGRAHPHDVRRCPLERSVLPASRIR